ncbi:hypothetical protein Pan258_45920 [Symmachiella dynata]|uniref:hypothetical protein n=1 Tax=Symmachiella dynata TaxID=2527995 RepID=UPI0011881DFA|nr:hypothetical protein [Symmachiella dynata]QDT50513.1 hypothetical protein Pan258_45920 [Symmachiella dynata]
MPVQVHGIDFPDDFPVQPYNAVHAKIHSAQQQPDLVFHQGGGWKGLAYRFLTAANADDRFTDIVGDEQNHLNRFHQEEALFNLFVNSLSAIECFFYGLYWIGTIAEPDRFPVPVPVTDDDLRKIKTDKTMSKFRTGPHAGIFTAAFAALQTQDSATGNWINTSPYEELKDVRNILAHRASHGRILHAAVGGGVQLDDEWRVRNIPINNQVTRSRRTWLVATLTGLLDSTEAYTAATL